MLPLVTLKALLAVGSVWCGSAIPQDHLFMDLLDVRNPYGLLVPTASTVSADNRFATPPGIAYETGAEVIAVLRSLRNPGEFEAYVENSTGWEPLPSAGGVSSHPPGPPGGPKGVSLVRFTTSDFVNWSPGRVVLALPKDTDGSSSLKSIARNDSSGRYVMFASYKGYVSFISEDHGLSWNEAKCSWGCVRKPDKDDLNLIFNKGKFVDMQITWRHNVSMRYCDSNPCDQARAVSVKTSDDGVDWSGNSSDLYLPDRQDPPDLQFYRTRPFYLGASGRLAAHTLLYSPQPPVAVVGKSYGRQPPRCKAGPAGYGPICHGPHIQEEWWVGPPSGSAADLHAWRRPFRLTRAAPHDAFLMAQPVTFDDAHLWVGSNRHVYTLPLYRLAGIWSPSNAEFSTQAIVLPANQIFINADVSWHGSLVTGGCDEGCAAYCFVELLDASSGAIIDGFSRYDFHTLMNQNDILLPLKWGEQNVTSSDLAGRNVTLRIGFRAATIFALMVDDHKLPISRGQQPVGSGIGGGLI